MSTFPTFTFNCFDDVQLQIIRNRGDLAPHADVLIGGENISSIMIMDNRYYIDANDLLPDDICQKLNEWMKLPSLRWPKSGMNNWEAVISTWNYTLDKGRIKSKEHIQPDFSTITLG